MHGGKNTLFSRQQNSEDRRQVRISELEKQRKEEIFLWERLSRPSPERERWRAGSRDCFDFNEFSNSLIF